ncbi:winged helix domain-containing protein [Sulfitobacter mediterraneus]|uniref:Winged helix domain-containing protein n=1 Tax=Sulfitobacter mediterraneus TaxID=83219 RepID=A0A2T6CD40_9RHOB|nr:hypothetical protein [Sulfitobacter mediterraneus]KIN79599.1 hypothetical protein Z950_133 [Sulfitobacter mediterraneus KCTC 32188]PTX73415.1 hypothetical protein C8N31_107116 [Sulfitobacter mediterraneus]
MKIEVTLLSEQPRTFELKGRLGWAMVQLVEAGAKGVTPITRPAPRWSGYVFDLRELGIPIETIMEPHKGIYPGTLARYVLSCDAEVQLLEQEACA